MNYTTYPLHKRIKTKSEPSRKVRQIESMIGIVVGVNLISPVNNVVQTVTTPTYTASVVSLTGVLPIIFVTVIILGAIACLITSSAPSKRNLSRIMSQILGSLRQLVCYGNQELNQSFVLCKGVENRGFTSYQGLGRWYVPILHESGENSIVLCEGWVSGIDIGCEYVGKGVMKGERSNSLPFSPWMMELL